MYNKPPPWPQLCSSPQTGSMNESQLRAKGGRQTVGFGSHRTEQHMLVGKMAVPNIQQLLQALLSTDNDTRSKAEVNYTKGEQIYNKSLENVNAPSCIITG